MAGNLTSSLECPTKSKPLQSLKTLSGKKVPTLCFPFPFSEGLNVKELLSWEA